MIHLIILAGALLFSPHPALYEAGKIINPVICRSDPAQSYALYIPAKGNKSPLPVVYFFDPHGDGSLPLNKYKALADEYNFILIGSNNSKNGNDWSTTEGIWRHLSGDVQARLKIDNNRIYTCGFSGGAKAAGYVALKHPGVKSVIANGAGLPDGVPAGDLSFSFTAIAGNGDMNLTDLLSFSAELDKSHTRHRVILFDGKHEWAPESTMRTAFAGLQSDAMQQGLIPKDDNFIDRYLARSKKRLDDDIKTGQLLAAGRECRLSISIFDGLTGEVAWFKARLDDLAGNKLYQTQRRAEEDLLVTEQNTKAVYMQHFQQGEMDYWTRTISGLQASVKVRSAETGMHQRLLAYLSLAFYSLSNHMIGTNANGEARYFVELYKKADPANGEAWYLSAVLNARDNRTQAAENDMLKAAGCGFSDKDRMMRQQEFKNLSPRIHFPRIGSSLHSPG